MFKHEIPQFDICNVRIPVQGTNAVIGHGVDVGIFYGQCWHLGSWAYQQNAICAAYDIDVF